MFLDFVTLTIGGLNMSGQSVGLIVLTEVPPTGLLVAVLRERGFFNFEKMRPESWPGGCQVTVHGKIDEGEKPLDALYRETREEVGEEFAKIVFSRKKPALIFSKHNADGEVFTYAVKIVCELLWRIRLSPDSGSIRFLQQAEIGKIRDITDYGKNTGVQCRNTIAMFSDEKQALEIAFKLDGLT